MKAKMKKKIKFKLKKQKNYKNSTIIEFRVYSVQRVVVVDTFRFQLFNLQISQIHLLQYNSQQIQLNLKACHDEDEHMSIN